MRVRIGQVLVYHPNAIDRIENRHGLASGTLVKVVKGGHGCPPANAMNHCFVGERETGKFIGLVHCNSLHTVKEWAAYTAKMSMLLGLQLLGVTVAKSTYENVKGGSQALFDELVESGHVEENADMGKGWYQLTAFGRDACKSYGK